MNEWERENDKDQKNIDCIGITKKNMYNKPTMKKETNFHCNFSKMDIRSEIQK
jgi:hypothetical protein